MEQIIKKLKEIIDKIFDFIYKKYREHRKVIFSCRLLDYF